MTADYRQLSLWFDQIDEPLDARPALSGDLEVDVAIVGAGFTGLWTAYYLAGLAPDLRIAVLESQIAGFGASGRNGGWCSALFPVSAARLAREHGHEAAAGMYAAMRASVTEVVRVAHEEEIDTSVTAGGTVVLARSQAQLTRARDEVIESDQFGLGVQLLDAAQARSRLAATTVRGGTFTPHCAVIQPARLVRGLARAVEARGVTIFEHTSAVSLSAHRIHTARGTVRAATTVRATEGYTARLAGDRRALAPVYSLMISTEPLPDTVWSEIGLRERETFSDFRHLIIYGQRSADNRLVFGGRGAPYHFASGIEARFDRVPRVFDALRDTVVDLFPVLRDVRVTHRWGGPLGVARDWQASVGLDPRSGSAWAGGYVGDGVSTTNLAGRTLADLIIGHDTELTRLPWVGHRSPQWEPEPLRYVGINAGLQAMTWADRAEQRHGRPSHLAAGVQKLVGH